MLGVAVAVVLAAGAGWWGYRAWSGNGTEQDPEVTAATERLQSFLGAWAAGDAAKAAALSDSPENAESLLASVTTNLKPAKAELSAGRARRTTRAR